MGTNYPTSKIVSMAAVKCTADKNDQDAKSIKLRQSGSNEYFLWYTWFAQKRTSGRMFIDPRRGSLQRVDKLTRSRQSVKRILSLEFTPVLLIRTARKLMRCFDEHPAR